MKYTTHQTVQIQPNSHEVYYTPNGSGYNQIVMKYTTHQTVRYNQIVMKYTTHQTVQIQPNSHEVYYTPNGSDTTK